ncbi:MAG: DPP IV N-terminal domain-containing protein, partial [Gemmatimonadota bacterium]
MNMRSRAFFSLILALAGLAHPAPGHLFGQDRLPSMPGHLRFQELSPQIRDAMISGALSVTWAEDGGSFQYVQTGQNYSYDVSTGEVQSVPGEAPTGQGRSGMGSRPARGRQYDSALSPDSTRRAFYRDRNLFISAPDGTGEITVTTEGDEAARTKFGTGSWVYGEELNQNTAMWWSSDGSKLAYYGFDEGPVIDYYLQMDQTQTQSSLDVEAYPKAGAPNPVVTLFVYDMATGASTEMDVRDGKPFTNEVVGHYAYRIEWSPDGGKLTFQRTNRRQNINEFTACTPSTGACRAIVREEWPASWVENHPPRQYLSDGQRFLWLSERTGWQNIYLYDMSGELLATVTNHEFEVANLVRVDEEAGLIYYMARDGDNHMKMQLHRVGLDGAGDKRLTDPAFNHSVTLSPDGKYFVDVAQTHDIPPFTRLLDSEGSLVAELATSDLTRFEELGLQKVEMFTFTGADGVTQLHGMLHKPSNFDPGQEYPVLVSVYAGPATNGARETFTLPNALTEYGFLVVSMDSRSAAGRGKHFLDAIYLKLSTGEIDDQAAGIRALWDRPYVAKGRAGIYGTSYGGTASAMALLRNPDVFKAASASSAVTDWRNYDSIYTERYMWIPQENQEGYDAGSAMKYAEKLEGELMLFFGTADNNVHPSNTLQLISALQRAGKHFQL